jgi:hypothetical protein
VSPALDPSTRTQLATQALWDAFEPEFEQMIVCGAVVERDGAHYRIVSGGESWEELEARARRLEGLCECGAPLSSMRDSRTCRTCGRVFPG